MKIVLQFNLPDEQDDYEAAYNGHKYRMILEELDQKLRNGVKHGVMENGRNLTPEEMEFASQIRDALYELLSEHNLSLY